jgi:predicted PurR-regulated permease PerM
MDDNRFMKFSAAFVVLFLAGVILKLARPVLFPFFLALFISYIIRPALEFLTRRKVPRPVALIVIILVTFSLMYILGAVFYSSGKAFAAELPDYTEQFQSLIKQLEASHFLGAKWNVATLLGNINVGKIASITMSALGPFFGFLSNLFLVLIFLIFILAGRGRLRGKVERSFRPGRSMRSWRRSTGRSRSTWPLKPFSVSLTASWLGSSWRSSASISPSSSGSWPSC